MENLSIVTWNINGIRSRIFNSKTSAQLPKNKKIYPNSDSPIMNLINETNADVICLQETRCDISIGKYFVIEGYKSYFNSSKGEGARSANRYSGTVIYTKYEPDNIEYQIPDYDDDEGRIIIMYFNKYSLVIINVYTPNSGSNFPKRLEWQTSFYNFLNKIKNEYENIIFAGDLNVSWRFEDVHINYKKSSSYKNENQASKYVGFLPDERKFLENLIEINYIDSILECNCDSVNNKEWINEKQPNLFTGYTWWDPRTIKLVNPETNIPMCAMRLKNYGWRPDYILYHSENNKMICSKCLVLKHIGEESSPQASDHGVVHSYFTIKSSAK